MLQHVLALSAFFAFPNRPLAKNVDARFFADLGLTIVAGFVLAFDFVLRAAAAQPGTEAYAIALIGAFLDWLMFVVLTVGAARKRDPEARATFALLLAASMAYLFANYFYARDVSRLPGGRCRRRALVRRLGPAMGGRPLGVAPLPAADRSPASRR